MEKQIKIEVPENLEKLANKLKNKAELFIVGGYVRNSILGIGGTDIDLCSSLTPSQMKEILAGTNYKIKEKNKKLGTITIEIEDDVFEHTTFRKEEYADDGSHTPISICFVDDIREDAKRRDFTINSIYYSITKNKLIDIYSGIFDLYKKRVKCIETPEYVFENDGLRILRMIRIACELNFKIDKPTFLTAQKMVYHLKDISGARKQKELLLILNAGTKYSVSSSKAHIKALKMFNRLQIWTAYYSTASKVKLKITKKAKSDYLCALLIDMINAINPDCVDYYLRYMLGSKALSFSEKQTDYFANIVCGYFDALNRLNNKKYFFKYYQNFEKIGEFIRIKNIFLFNKYNFFYKYIQGYHIPIQVKDLLVNGDDIKKLQPKMQPKYYGVVLKDLLSRVFDNEIQNDRNVLLEEIKNYEYNKHN